VGVSWGVKLYWVYILKLYYGYITVSDPLERAHEELHEAP
jgi:hypothetical protein